MVTIRIGNETRTVSEGGGSWESWIAQQLDRRGQDGQSTCIEVSVETSGLNLRLTTPACGRGGGGGRMPNPNEKDVIALWEKRGLNEDGFSAGNLIAFLKQLLQRLG